MLMLWVQEQATGVPELGILQPVIDSCFLPALHYRAMGKSTAAALDDAVADLLNAAQGNAAAEVRQFCVDTLDALQRLCPMSMAVTLRHYAAVYQAVRAGEPHGPQFRA
jgi:hypothetical protein